MIFAVALVVVTGCAGLGLIAWWGRDMLAARHSSNTAPAPVAAVEFHHTGPGLSPQTVTVEQLGGPTPPGRATP